MSKPSNLTFQIVHAFTQEGKNTLGNPAAVCLVDAFPDQDSMERAGAILKRPMTSFVRKTDDPLVFDIRHFTPEGHEDHVCGHATIAATEYIASTNPDFYRSGKEIVFRLNPLYQINPSNSFRVLVEGKDLSLTIPAALSMQPVDDPEFYERLSDALNIPPDAIVRPSYYVSNIINYVVGIKDQFNLLSIAPDVQKMKALAVSEKFPHEGIMATSQSEMKGFDILTRVFLPIIGVDEDIACGSANCSVVPYWKLHRGDAFPADKTDFRALFPYPPRLNEGVVGGIQDLSLDLATEEVTVKGQATHVETVALDVNAAPEVKRSAPPPFMPQMSNGP